MCRPRYDIDAEKWARDEDEDEDDDTLYTCNTDACVCDRPLSARPEWKWCISKRGLTTHVHLHNEAMHRDQDFMGEYVYNDFSGYGFQEVVENHVRELNGEGSWTC